MRKIIIVVEPVVGRPGYFAAALDGVGLCISREPLLAAARELDRRGAPPDTILAMRHAGSDHDALRGQLGLWRSLPFRTVGTVCRDCAAGRPPEWGVPSPIRFPPHQPSREGAHEPSPLRPPGFSSAAATAF